MPRRGTEGNASGAISSKIEAVSNGFVKTVCVKSVISIHCTTNRQEIATSPTAPRNDMVVKTHVRRFSLLL